MRSCCHLRCRDGTCSAVARILLRCGAGNRSAMPSICWQRSHPCPAVMVPFATKMPPVLPARDDQHLLGKRASRSDSARDRRCPGATAPANKAHCPCTFEGRRCCQRRLGQHLKVAVATRASILAAPRAAAGTFREARRRAPASSVRRPPARPSFDAEQQQDIRATALGIPGRSVQRGARHGVG